MPASGPEAISASGVAPSAAVSHSAHDSAAVKSPNSSERSVSGSLVRQRPVLLDAQSQQFAERRRIAA